MVMLRNCQWYAVDRVVGLWKKSVIALVAIAQYFVFLGSEQTLAASAASRMSLPPLPLSQVLRVSSGDCFAEISFCSNFLGTRKG